MKEPFKVWKDIYQVGGPSISARADCCVYLMDADSELVLIDSGAGQSFDGLIQNIKNLDFDLDKLKSIIATHAHIDHVGSLANFKDKFGIEVIAHRLDAKSIETGEGVGAEWYGVTYEPCGIDVKLSEDEGRLEFGKHELRFLRIPGHTPGSIACYLDVGGKRVLFGQDVHGPYNLPRSNPSKAKKSLQKLLDLQADILCEGHSGIYRPKKEVEEYIKTYLESL